MNKEWLRLTAWLQPMPRLIVLTGAGGKTTTMFRLAEVFSDQGLRVMATTTTHICSPDLPVYDRLWLEDSGTAVPEGAGGSVTLAGRKVNDEGKLVGLKTETLDRLFEDRAYDVILAEADGSRGKPVKAPADYEPVIPNSATDVLGLIGMDCWGRSASEETVHRLDCFLKVTGLKVGDPIDEDALLRLIEDPYGLFKGVPQGARMAVVLNKTAFSGRAAEAESLLARLRGPAEFSGEGFWL